QTSPGRPHTSAGRAAFPFGTVPHQHSDVVRCGRQQVAFLNFLHPAKPGPPRASGLADVSEGPLDELTPLALHWLATLPLHASPIGVDRSLLFGRLVGPAAVVF